MKAVFTKITVLCLMGAILMAGCSDKNDELPSAGSDGTVIADITEKPAKPPVTETPKTDEEIRATYAVSPEDSVKLAGENTEKPITYTGFTAHHFHTPAKVDGLPRVTATPYFSQTGLHGYVNDNSDSYNLGDGTGSFSVESQKYNGSYFDGKGIVVVSFLDPDGGDNYEVTGAFEEAIPVGEDSLKQLVLTVKKTHGHSTAGHLLIEMDTDFIGLWDMIAVSFYS